MTKLYEKPIQETQKEFTQAEVLEIAKTETISTFKAYDQHVLKHGGWFWTGIWFELDGKKGKAWHINNPKKVKKYADLPLEEGWYILDEFGMPKEKCLESNKDARYFWRMTKYSGLFRRDGGSGGRGVGADWGRSGSHGVLIEEKKMIL